MIIFHKIISNKHPATFDGNQLVINGKNGKKAMTIYLQFDDESGNSMSGTVGEMDVVLYR